MGKSPLVIIFLTVFLYLVGFGLVIPILPILGEDLGGSAQGVGFLMTVFSLMQFITAPFWGQFSDRFGRRPILLLCLIGEALSYVLFAYARDFNTLLLARVLAGFFGGSISTASAYISDVTSRHERTKGMALIGVAFGLGFVVGPALGGGLVMWAEKISTEPFFASSFASLVVAGICFLTFLFAVKFLKESLPKEKRVSRRQEVGRLQRIGRAFFKPTLGSLMAVFFFGTLAMSAMEATLVLLVRDRFSWGIKEVSFGFAYIGVLVVLSQGFIVRRFVGIIGERKLLVLGLFMFTLGMAGIAFSHTVAAIAIAMTLLSLGHGMINPTIMSSISLLSASSEQGENLGLSHAISALGRIVGPVLGGLLFDKVGMQSPYLLAAGLGALNLLLTFKIYRSIPQEGKDAHDAEGRLGLIGHFQLENLVRNKVPFTLLEIDLPKNKIPSQLSSLLQNAHAVQNAGVQALLKQKGAGPDEAIVLLCFDGKKSGQWSRKLKKQGFLNVYVVQRGIEGLIQDMESHS